MAKVAILGYGTVGSGIYDVLITNSDSITVKAGEPVDVKYVLDLREFPGDPVSEVLVHDFNIILNDPEVEVVAEAMGGLNPAYHFAEATLKAGKSYCTSNKELVEKYGVELVALAKEQGRNFFFEASVGGGIPIIRPMLECLTADKITSVTGILNGTTNYILTKMSQGGEDFHTALREAQELGYAERDPSADVEGYDACRKIAILASLAFGKNVDYEDIYMEGIQNISDMDFRYAEKLGMSIKLLAEVRVHKGNIYSCVAPMLVEPENPLCSVNGVYNSILVEGDKAGRLMFFGRGAGKLPTASAVAADVIAAVRAGNNHLPVQWEKTKLVLTDFSTSTKMFFVRVSGKLEEKAKLCENAFGVCKFMILEGEENEFGLLTQTISEGEFSEAANKVDGIISRIRLAWR